MLLFPFYSAILKTSLNRSEVSEAIAENTFLSDAGYKRTDGRQKFFFGITSPDEFYLETIENKGKLTAFVRGNIKGVDHDIYVFLSLRAFRYRRIFVLILLFTLFCLGMLASDLYKYGIQAFSQPGTIMFSLVTASLIVYVLYSGITFQAKIRSSIDFFRGMLQADEVKSQDVPMIFRD